MSVTQKTTPPA